MANKRRRRVDNVDQSKKLSRRKDSTMAELPFDILLEIASHASPLDLLHLARVNTLLRATFMSKSSVGAWRAARDSQKGFPAPFGSMSEPAWAHLLFDKICHFCWTKTVHSPDFNLHCRACPSCTKTHIVDSLTLYAKHPAAEHARIFQIFQLIPTRITVGRGGTSVYHACRIAFEEAERHFLNTEYLASQRSMIKDLDAHVELCHAWKNACDDEREKELERMKEARRQVILTKLRELGYNEDMGYVNMDSHFIKHVDVRGTHALTTQGWEKIRVAMIAFAEEVRELHKVKTHLIKVNERKLQARVMLRAWKRQQPMPPDKFLPSIADFCEFPNVEPILDQPDDEVVTAYDFDMYNMPKLCIRWRAGLYRRMYKVASGGLEIGRGPGTAQAAFAFLHLARNVFVCGACSEIPDYSESNRKKKLPVHATPMWFPGYLTHECCRSGYVPREAGKLILPPDPALRLDGHVLRGRVPWRGDECLFKNVVMERIVRTVIRLVDLDEETVTVAEMDNTRRFFECKWCLAALNAQKKIHPSLPNREFGHWRVFVEHMFNYHYFEYENLVDNIEMMDGWDANAAPAGFDALECEDVYLRYGCVHCHDMPTEELNGEERPDIIKHLAFEHGIYNARENEDFCELAGTRPKGRRRDRVFLYTDERAAVKRKMIMANMLTGF